MPFLADNDELRELSRREVNVVLLVALACFFTSFNFVVYFSFNDAIMGAFLPQHLDNDTKRLAFWTLIFSAYLARPLGGGIFADFADRVGRKNVFIYSLFMVMVSNFLIAVLPTYEHIGGWAIVLLIVARLMQGLGMGAKLPISWVYVIEQVPRFRVGWASSLITASLILPIFFANLINHLLSAWLNMEQMTQYGWRIPFFLGAIGSLITVFLRYRLTEAPLWLMAKNHGELLNKLPIKRVFEKYRYGFLVTFFLSFFVSGVSMITFLLLPELAITYFDVDSKEIWIANSVAVLFACSGALLFGYCADKFNAGKVFGIGCIFLAMSGLLFFYHLAKDAEFILLYYVIFGFFSGMISVVPSICVRLFHTKVRCSGVSLAYNLAYAITGTFTPVLLVYIANKLALAPALYLVFLCVCGVMMSLLLTNLHGLYRLEKIS